MSSIEVINVVDLGRLETMAEVSVVMIVLFFIMIGVFLSRKGKEK